MILESISKIELATRFGCLLCINGLWLPNKHMTYFEQIKLTNRNRTSTERIRGEHKNNSPVSTQRLGMFVRTLALFAHFIPMARCNVSFPGMNFWNKRRTYCDILWLVFSILKPICIWVRYFTCDAKHMNKHCC